MTDLSTLTDHELDALIAEMIMGVAPCDGWDDVNFGSAGGPALLKSDRCQHAPDTCYSTRIITTGFGQTIGGPPQYSANRNVTALVLEKIEQLGLQSSFCHILRSIHNTKEFIPWLLISATPRQLSEAAYRAWEAK